MTEQATVVKKKKLFTFNREKPPSGPSWVKEEEKRIIWLWWDQRCCVCKRYQQTGSRDGGHRDVFKVMWIDRIRSMHIRVTVQLCWYSQRGQTGHVQRTYLQKDAEDGRVRQKAQREEDTKSVGAEDKAVASPGVISPASLSREGPLHKCTDKEVRRSKADGRSNLVLWMVYIIESVRLRPKVVSKLLG